MNLKRFNPKGPSSLAGGNTEELLLGWAVTLLIMTYYHMASVLSRRLPRAGLPWVPTCWLLPVN